MWTKNFQNTFLCSTKNRKLEIIHVWNYKVHLKKIEYHEKGQYFLSLISERKSIYYIDSLHRVKYFKPLVLEILMIMAYRYENPKFSRGSNDRASDL